MDIDESQLQTWHSHLYQDPGEPFPEAFSLFNTACSSLKVRVGLDRRQRNLMDPLSAEVMSESSAGCWALLQVPTVSYFLSLQEVAFCSLPVKEAAWDRTGGGSWQ